MDEIYIGEVIHYYSNLKVAVVALEKDLSTGDIVHFKSPDSREAKVDFEQKVVSMEIEHHKIEAAEPSQEVATKVDQRVRKKDRVYKKV
jgi:hypothetical protein